MDDLAVFSAPSVKRYTFAEIARCNMCGADAARTRVLGLRLNRSQGRWPSRQTGIAVTVCRCESCGLVFCNPQPRPYAISDHYGLPPESYWRTVSTTPPAGLFAREIATAKRLLGSSNLKVIDVGVGLGLCAKVMIDAGFDVYGIEPSEPFHRKALEVLGVGADRIRNVSIEAAEFDEGGYDFVTFGAVLEHLYDPAEALSKALRWLKPGGVIHAEVPNAGHLVGRIINAYFHVIGSSYVTNLSPMHVPFHLYEFALKSFERHGEKAGYALQEHYVEVCSIYNIPRVFHGLLRSIMSRNETGMQLVVFLRKTG